MFEDFAPKLARVLTEYSQPLAPGQKALVMTSPEAMPLVEALYEAVLRRGGLPAGAVARVVLVAALLGCGVEGGAVSRAVNSRLWNRRTFWTWFSREEGASIRMMG